MLMLTLAQVIGIGSKPKYPVTLIKHFAVHLKQVKYDGSLLRQIGVFVE